MHDVSRDAYSEAIKLQFILSLGVKSTPLCLTPLVRPIIGLGMHSWRFPGACDAGILVLLSYVKLIVAYLYSSTLVLADSKSCSVATISILWIDSPLLPINIDMPSLVLEYIFMILNLLDRKMLLYIQMTLNFQALVVFHAIQRVVYSIFPLVS